MRTLAVVTIKRLSEAKQRLADAASQAFRTQLAEAMLDDVLARLAEVEHLSGICVVTADKAARQAAERAQTAVLDDPSQAGQSEAAKVGAGYAERGGYERVLVMPADTPLADPRELDALLGRKPAGSHVVIVPDRRNEGTNALVISPPRAFEPSFGPSSRARHEAQAKASGVPFEIAAIPSLALDIDTPEDLDLLIATTATDSTRCPRTHAVLARQAAEPNRGRGSRPTPLGRTR